MLAVFASWFRSKDYKLFESFISLPRWNPGKAARLRRNQRGNTFQQRWSGYGWTEGQD